MSTEELWSSWLESNDNGELFIDSLDEGNLKISDLSLHITRWLKKLGTNVLNRLRIHLSCREADWLQLDKEKWIDLFSSEYITLSLLNLDRTSIYKYCEHFEIDGNVFLKEIPSSAISFIQRPQTLKMLLGNYKNDKEYIANTTELYRSSIEFQLQEKNEQRKPNSPLKNISLLKQHEILGYYAVTTILCGREIIAVDDVDTQKHILFGFSKTPHEEENIFKTPIFEPFTDGQYRFNQPDIANYLAACSLNTLIKNDSVQIKILLHLFFPSTHTNETVPRLRDLIAWLCNLNKEFRHEIFAKNPSIILHEYYDIPFEDADCLTIWQWVVEHYGKLDWFDDKWLRPYCGKLACEAIIPKLKEVFTEQFGRNIRELALIIIKKGKLGGFLTEITEIINDGQPNETHVPFVPLRLEAVHVLAITYPEKIPILENLLNIPTEQDPDNSLFWITIYYLWPKYIIFDTLINYLASDKKRITHHEMFIYEEILKQFSIEQNVKILNIIIPSLKDILSSIRTGKGYEYKLSGLEHYFGELLLIQLEKCKDKPEKLPDLESWLIIYEQVYKSKFLLTNISSYKSTDKIQQFINEEHGLRRNIYCYRIQRIYAEKKEDFKSHRFLWNEINYIQKHDLEFWQQTLLAWSSKEFPLLESIWYIFKASWAKNDYSPKILEWIENEFPKYPNLAKIWEEHKIRSRNIEIEEAESRQEHNKYQAEHRQKLTNWIKYIQKNIDKLTEGNEYLLDHLRRLHSESDNKISFEDWTKNKLGNDVFDAYQTGLYSYWQNSEVPNLEQIYSKNHIPNWAIIVQYAVEAWKGQWSDITTDMRHKALQAGFFALNTLPDWYQELAFMEKEYVNKLFNKFLNLDLEQKQYSSTVQHLKQLDNNFYDIAYNFIIEHSDCRLEMLIPLLQYIVESKLDEVKVDMLWKYAESSVDEDRKLIYFAAIWRFEPLKVWTWLENNFLNNEQRTVQFETWISAISKLHMFGIGEHWPSWTNEKALLAMIPDFFATYPPETANSNDEISSGDHEINQRSHRDRLLYNTMSTIAASGEIFVKEEFNEMLKNPQMQPYHEHLSYALEQWQHAHADSSWKPLEQEELWQVLEKNAYPVKTHKDLFDLVCEIMTDIKNEISGGEANLKALLWENKTEKKENWKPSIEGNLQILIANEIKKHPILQNKLIVVGRELEVNEGNHPDIFINCILPNNEKAKVYIEIKRQQHKDLLTAISEQLAKKYLCDPEARYGIYLVGWYGTEFIISGVNKLKEKCGKKPTTAQELEKWLQTLCDEVTENQEDIDDMKAIVIDVSL